MTCNMNSSKTPRVRTYLISLAVALLIGCSDGSDSGVLDPE